MPTYVKLARQSAGIQVDTVVRHLVQFQASTETQHSDKQVIAALLASSHRQCKCILTRIVCRSLDLGALPAMFSFLTTVGS